MHTERLLSLFGLVAPALASGLSPLVARQGGYVSCSTYGQQACGEICIDPGDVCCPDQSGGCAPPSVCQLGSNNQYGCCSPGDTCYGNGGVMSMPYIGSMTETFNWFPTELPTSTVGPFSEPSPPPAMTTADSTPTPCSQQSGMKACGDAYTCISESDSCCPDGSGYCPSGEQCVSDSAGGYSCCMDGQQCGGSGVDSGLGSNPSASSSTSASPFAASTSSSAGGDASSRLAASGMTMFGSFLVGLFPGFLG